MVCLVILDGFDTACLTGLGLPNIGFPCAGPPFDFDLDHGSSGLSRILENWKTAGPATVLAVSTLAVVLRKTEAASLEVQAQGGAMRCKGERCSHLHSIQRSLYCVTNYIPSHIYIYIYVYIYIYTYNYVLYIKYA